jgi:hypothetical protein
VCFRVAHTVVPVAMELSLGSSPIPLFTMPDVLFLHILLECTLCRMPLQCHPYMLYAVFIPRHLLPLNTRWLSTVLRSLLPLRGLRLCGLFTRLSAHECGVALGVVQKAV